MYADFENWCYTSWFEGEMTEILAVTLWIWNYCFLLFCKHTYDGRGFPYENTAENVFIMYR